MERMQTKLYILHLCVVSFCQLLILACGGEIQSPLIIDTRGASVTSLCRTSGHFAMTFDGGPSIHTGAVLDAFDKKNLKATFHPLVTYLQDVSIVANLQRAAMTGHLIGLSIEPDLDLFRMDVETILAVIRSRVDALYNVIGQKAIHLRLPNVFKLKPFQLEAITKAGFIITTYNLDSYDYAPQATEESIVAGFRNVLELLSNNTKGGFISVQRDTVASSVQVTSKIIDYVQSKGYKLVTLKDCIGGSHPSSISNSDNVLNDDDDETRVIQESDDNGDETNRRDNGGLLNPNKRTKVNMLSKSNSKALPACTFIIATGIVMSIMLASMGV